MTNQYTQHPHDHDGLNALEEYFVPSSFRRSIRFIKESREPGRGWPTYVGGPSNLHETSLAIHTIGSFGDESLDWLTASAVTYIRKQYEDPQEPDLASLISLLRAALAEKRPDFAWADELSTRLSRALRKRMEDRQSLITQVLSDGLIVLTPRYAGNPIVRELADLLIARQNTQIGGWAAVDVGTESFVSTAWATRALARCEGDQALRAVSGGIAYLRSVLEEGGWDHQAETGGTLAVALGLRAFVAGQSDGSADVEAASAWLRSAMNKDGGWGGALGEPSNIEYTCYAIMSLIESGVNRFVPFVAASEALMASERKITELSAERDSLAEQFENRVEELCGRVAEERDKLRDQVRAERARMRSLQARLEKDSKRVESMELQLAEQRTRGGYDTLLQQEPVLRILSRADRVLPIALISVGTLCITLALALLLLDPGMSWIASSVIGVVGLGLFVAGSIWVYHQVRISSLVRRRYRHSVMLRGSELWPGGETVLGSGRTPSVLGPGWAAAEDDLVDQFRYAGEELRGDVREELIYRLLRDGADIPRTSAGTYIRETVLELGIPPRSSQRLEAWLERLFTLDVDSRRSVIRQLRRAIL